MYGENGARLRTELSTLLRQHRIQQRIGGQGIHTVPESTTTGQREMLGEQIRRYRESVLTWCLQAAGAASPQTNLYGSTGRSRGPAEELRYRLTHALETSTAGRPTLTELTTEQEFPMVETWRQAARSAALGEHDFGAGIEYGQLSAEQCMTVLKDAAEITNAVVVLDKRYDNIPGWAALRDQGRLGRAAEVGAVFAGYGKQDYTVDVQGWRPPACTIDGPPLPGFSGVLQAEHNMLIHLTQYPNALNLKRVLDSQRVLSHEMAKRASGVAPELAQKWLTRTQTYTTLVRETRNIGGLVGGGGLAAAEGANAISRLRKAPISEVLSHQTLREVDKLFTRADTQLAAIFEHGISEPRYFLRVKLPRVVDQSEHLISPVRTRYVPIYSPIQSDLVHIVREQLLPAPAPPVALASSARSRQELQAAFEHRPDSRGSLGL